jgi:hypothetical protein
MPYAMAVTRIHCIVSAVVSRGFARIADGKERIFSLCEPLTGTMIYRFCGRQKRNLMAPQAQSGRYAGLCIKSI